MNKCACLKEGEVGAAVLGLKFISQVHRLPSPESPRMGLYLEVRLLERELSLREVIREDTDPG